MVDLATTPTSGEAQRVTYRSDRAAVSHLVISTGFLVLAGLLTVLALATLVFPVASNGALQLGRVRPVASTAALLGWLVTGLVGAVYYLLPRLTGTTLANERLARLGGLALAVLTLAGMVVVGLGGGDGVEPFSLPLWLDIPVLGVLLIPLAVTVQTVRNRSEEGVYVSLWFLMAGVAWLPLLYALNAIPGLAGVGVAVQGAVFDGAFPWLWVLTIGAGVAYYVVVKDADVPLANRQLARVGFWSLAFGAGWAGLAPLVHGATPDWIDGLAAVLTLTLPVAALANAVGVSATVERAWAEAPARPAVAAAVNGLLLAVVAAVLTSAGAFSSTAAVIGLTSYWDGVAYLAVFGMGGLLVAAFAYQSLPAMTGRSLPEVSLAGLHIQLTMWGTLGASLLLVAGGIVTGYSWTGGAFAGSFSPVGAGWAEGSGLATLFAGLSILAALVTLTGQLVFALVVYRTFTSGHAGPQEVLVETSR